MNRIVGAKHRTRSGLLALALFAACGGSPTEAPSVYETRFEEIWRRFDAIYPYFIHKGVDWTAARATYLPRAQAANSQDELVQVVVAMLGTLHDVHAWLIRPDGTTLPTWTPTRLRNWERDPWLRSVARLGYQSTSSWGWGRSGDIGYLMIGDWNSSRVSAAALDGALEDLRDARALVIDVRPNGGGNDAIAFDFAGRFTTRDVVTEHVRFRNGPDHADFTAPTARTLRPRGPWTWTRPVFVLSGRGAFSSNESFIAAMRELPNVTIVGDTTGGGTGNPAPHPLGAGWQYMVPRWIATTVDGIVIEDTGIPPDIHVPFSTVDGVDTTLERALEIAGMAGSAGIAGSRVRKSVAP